MYSRQNLSKSGSVEPSLVGAEASRETRKIRKLLLHDFQQFYRGCLQCSKKCDPEAFLACVITKLGIKTGFLPSPSPEESKNLTRFFYGEKLRVLKLVYATLGFCPSVVPSELKVWYLYYLGPYNQHLWSYVQMLCQKNLFRQLINESLKK